MSRFIIEQSFWDIFPECEIGVLLINDIDNTEEGCEKFRPDIIEFLEQSNKEARKYLTEPVLSQNRVISVWRDAFSKFKTKKGARSSIEALLKRIEKGNEVGVINPLVDIYNGVSLRFALPCGMEDVDTFKGDLRLTVTNGGDPFLALGDEEIDYTLPGEICYLDDEGAVCRCWNWRDGQRTMLTEDTKNAIAVIESVDPLRRKDLEAALDTLSTWIEKARIGKVNAKVIMDENNRTLTIK
ncbi:MAG TPA: B3/4 domain-containing protein [Bacillota bacterium]|jgi:DNA/RNA-binding domain of Phe-tRNA-synthetase-like protein|nr:B3/4 domain-containing protein [Bacillota bacterium]HQE65626.1 B3/4 domain-containing protein [Bacillota bacterium]HQI15711.1 B3/4 domain-containing protein [Bacillota bacterium]HQJ37085.1 B3/4 domain-containing protein [Bacillota bacterium]HRS21375.1 B3/4 domain-containing protein [Clostridia bacterium]